MDRTGWVRLAASTALALSGGWAVAAVSAAAVPAAVAAAESGAGDCIAHHPNYSWQYEIEYTSSCTGHDEPELDPVSSLAGSAQDFTWTVVLPKDGTVPVSAVGPTFWFGGTVSDPNPHSLFGEAFLELQFYPDAIVKSCSTDGGFNVVEAPDEFSVCSPVWQVESKNNHEDAAFNAELYDGSSNQPLVMNGGDTVQIQFSVVSASEGWNVEVRDLTTGHSGLIVLNSKYGPLLPEFNQQEIGNSLGWGLVDDTPNAFVWEIGHTSDFSTPAGKLCLPGDTACDSYDTAHWLGITPLQIKSVTFADGSNASQWAVVSDQGGTAEVDKSCSAYGGPFCTYPWYALNGADDAFTYGADFDGTTADYGQGSQFATTPQCGGPFGADSTYCDTTISPGP